MNDAKSWPIRREKRWVRISWAVLGALSLLTSVFFLLRATKLGIPISWGAGSLMATAGWFAFGIVSPSRLKQVGCIAMALGVSVLMTTGSVLALALICAGFFAFSIVTQPQISQ